MILVLLAQNCRYWCKLIQNIWIDIYIGVYFLALSNERAWNSNTSVVMCTPIT